MSITEMIGSTKEVSDDPVKHPLAQIEASFHMACPSVVSTSPLACSSSHSTGIYVPYSCAGFHGDASGFVGE